MRAVDVALALWCTGALAGTLLFGGHGGAFVWMLWWDGWDAFLLPNLLSAGFLVVLWGGLLLRDPATRALTRVLGAQLGAISWLAYLHVANGDDGVDQLVLLALLYAVTL